MKIYFFTNKIWEKFLRIFGIKKLSFAQESLNLKKAIILVSDDKIQEFNNFQKKLEVNDVIITILPSDANANFNKNEVKALISKALGIAI